LDELYVSPEEYVAFGLVLADAVIVAVPVLAQVTLNDCKPAEGGGDACDTGVIVTTLPPSVSAIATGPLS
jgi:hypothetical protein